MAVKPHSRVCACIRPQSKAEWRQLMPWEDLMFSSTSLNRPQTQRDTLYQHSLLSQLLSCHWSRSRSQSYFLPLSNTKTWQYSYHIGWHCYPLLELDAVTPTVPPAPAIIYKHGCSTDVDLHCRPFGVCVTCTVRNAGPSISKNLPWREGFVYSQHVEPE